MINALVSFSSLSEYCIIYIFKYFSLIMLPCLRSETSDYYVVQKLCVFRLICIVSPWAKKFEYN